MLHLRKVKWLIIYQGTFWLKAFKEDFDAKELEDTLIMLLC